MPLFTLILEFESGTYISQRRAESPEQAFGEWCERMAADEIASGVSVDVALSFSDWESKTLIPIENVTNVWCTSGSTDHSDALLNIIQTAD